ncbi:hypothetical protein PsorP6_001314 [Peronosclerospora sorghi]|uniref:Uncharacterized protein n=1 Tax=Peronosclerospora sorghi TaxID=230839 RepID=A0ACC0WVW3_9STRA|nr:hypothetical protein PsorP6_001314 [Peronosclerospora sorghi]
MQWFVTAGPSIDLDTLRRAHFHTQLVGLGFRQVMERLVDFTHDTRCPRAHLLATRAVLRVENRWEIALFQIAVLLYSWHLLHAAGSTACFFEPKMAASLIMKPIMIRADETDDAKAEK